MVHILFIYQAGQGLFDMQNGLSRKVSRLTFLQWLGGLTSSLTTISDNIKPVGTPPFDKWTLSDKPPILIITGIDYPGHPWPQTSRLLANIINAKGHLDARIVEDPFFLDSEAIWKYKAIIFNFMNWEQPGPGLKAQQNLKQFVENGGGLVLVHFACGAWQEWPEFVKLAGRIWDPQKRPHDPRGVFKVRIVDPTHPITQNMQDFETDDELYTCLSGKEPIHVLATASSTVDLLDYPIAFVKSFGKGKVFHCVLGHDEKALTPTPVQNLFYRGVLWAAGLLH